MKSKPLGMLICINSPSLAQYCVTWQFKTDATTYTAFDCDGNDLMRVRELLATPLSLMTTTTTDQPDSSSSSSSDDDDNTDIDDSDTSDASSSADNGIDNNGAITDASDTSATATATPAGDSSSSSSSSTPTGAIVGGTVGGVVALILMAAVLFLVWRRKRAAAAGREQLTASPPPPPEGPQEISTSDSSYPDGYVPPNPYFDPKTHTHFFEAPDTPVVEAPNNEATVLHEAPNTATLGNRKELE